MAGNSTRSSLHRGQRATCIVQVAQQLIPMQGKVVTMLSKTHVIKLAKASRGSGEKAKQAKTALRQLAGGRIEEGRSYNNRIIFMARVAVDRF